MRVEEPVGGDILRRREAGQIGKGAAMAEVEGEEESAYEAAVPRGRPRPPVASLLFLALGLFLLAVLVFPGESHEGDFAPALKSWFPLLINSLLAGGAFAA